MKKLAILMILALGWLVSFSQNSTTFDYSMGDYDKTIMGTFVGATADTVGVGDSTWMYTIKKLSRGEVAATYRIALDKQRGAATPKLVNIFYQYSALGITYTNKDTSKYYGTVDTVIEKTVDYVKGDYFRILVSEGTPTIKVQIDTIKVKFFNK
jgi:hypothetical protein